MNSRKANDFYWKLIEKYINEIISDIDNGVKKQKWSFIIDRILNTIHGRGPISGWFLKGGDRDLDRLSGKKNIFEILLEDY